MRKEQSATERLLRQLSGVPEIIIDIEQRLDRDGRLGVNVGLQEGLFLKSLCSLPHIKKVVEIGTQYGCSATWMAMGLRERGQIWTLEKDPQCLQEARKTFAHQEFKDLKTPVHLIEGDAQESLRSLDVIAPFDLVFIDANKSATLKHWQWALASTRPGSLILVDNIFLFGSVFESQAPESVPPKMWQAMRGTLEEALIGSQVTSSLLPTPEGLLLSIRQ